MIPFEWRDNALIWRSDRETVCIQAWGPNCLRVRARPGHDILDQSWALLDPSPTKADIEIHQALALIANGKLRAEVSIDGHICFFHQQTGKKLLEEEPPLFFRPPVRFYRACSGDLYHIEVRFSAWEDERFYGLGQQIHGRLNHKGCVIALTQRNSEISIPFLLSSRGYGFLWNNPAIGRVELGMNGTRWVAEAARQVDYVVIAGDSYAEILDRYADLTGHPPLLPAWATGFWQSKYRYRTQEELLQVAREYKRRNLPLSVIALDMIHTPAMGDWRFNLRDFPDPAGMVRELDELGVKLMVSVWPAVTVQSQNYREMQKRGLLIRTEKGIGAHSILWVTPQDPLYLHFYDATNPEARRYLWAQMKQNYSRFGVKVWWLDACEPEIYPQDHENLRYFLGNGLEVGNIYPLLHQQGFYEGMKAEGEDEIVLLCRSAWAGSQRYGAAVWSGDIASTFESLQVQVRAGLNMGLSGIPWWTTDIGGFIGGDITSPYFRELIVRWFQYGCFCPLLRLHGWRSPNESPTCGAPNEVWSYGEDVYAILKEYLLLRERLRSYIQVQAHVVHERGIPLMRPLFFDFMDDENCGAVDDAFLFGPEVLVAPVLYEGAREREVYLPAGTSWMDAWSGQVFAGGQWVRAAAPLERIPVYLREGSSLRDAFAAFNYYRSTTL